MRYAFTGEFDQFPAIREAMEQAGIILVATSTDDNILHVETQDSIAQPDSYQLVEA